MFKGKFTVVGNGVKIKLNISLEILFDTLRDGNW